MNFEYERFYCLFLIDRFLFKVKTGLQLVYSSFYWNSRSLNSHFHSYCNTLYIKAVLLTWFQGLYFSTVLLLSNITTVNKRFQVKQSFFSFHLTLSDFCLYILLSSMVVEESYVSTDKLVFILFRLFSPFPTWVIVIWSAEE